jgi:hypothetical protein
VILVKKTKFRNGNFGSIKSSIKKTAKVTARQN